MNISVQAFVRRHKCEIKKSEILRWAAAPINRHCFQQWTDGRISKLIPGLFSTAASRRGWGGGGLGGGGCGWRLGGGIDELS